MRTFNVKVNGKSYSVEVEETVAGESPAVTSVAPAAESPIPAPAPIPAGGIEVKSPMPGLVLRFSVADGAKVKKNDTVMVIEAMKMETDIISGADGVVRFSVKKGDTVDTGTVLAVIAG